MHLDEAMKALDAGDTAGAEMHMTEADKVVQEGAAKMHLDEAIKALQAGDITGAETHAQMAQDSL
jgi:cellobiose-specific phosphotransferase system component IIA